jgi:hypothetical protein
MTDEQIRAFVIAAHSDLATVKATLAEHPDWLNVEYDWGPGGRETSLGAAAHVGNRPIAEYLLDLGAPYNICVAAMLARADDVARFLADDPAQATARGAHGIPLMVHAALGGDVGIVEQIVAAGGGEGIRQAMIGAVMKGRLEMTRWLLDHGADDLTLKNHDDKTLLQMAEESGFDEIAALLRERGAVG